MTASVIPSHCPACGGVFQSRLISISGNVKNLTISGNKESCPFCGSMANTAEGVFDLADGVLSIIYAPQLTKQMLQKLDELVAENYFEKADPEILAKKAEQINPAFGILIRNLNKNKKLYFTGLLLILFAIKSCSLNVNLDCNKLIDQIKGVPPKEMILTERVEKK